MDREQEDLRFLGLFGIVKESLIIILSWRKIFSQITVTLILPLCFIFLAHIQVTELIFFDIINNQDAIYYIPKTSKKYTRISDIISMEWTAFWVFKAVYFTFLLILSLLSTSAVVYTIACAYTGKHITFKKVMTVVPKVWKRLMFTFLWNFASFFAFNVVIGLMFFCWAYFSRGYSSGIPTFVALVILYLVGFVYLSIVWHLASVVSVLEDVYGFQAMIKSKSLIKGKMKVSCFIFFILSVLLIGVELMYEILVVPGNRRHLGIRSLVGLLCFLLLLMAFLFGLVAQTVIYFACKSYHHENIDKSLLADHLEEFLGEYVPLTAKDVQLGEIHV